MLVRFTSVLQLALLLATAAAAMLQAARQKAVHLAPGFVAANGTRLQRSGQEYYISGANYWQAMHLGMEAGASSNRARVLSDLQRLEALGINTLRILASSEGAIAGTGRIGPPLMPAPGVYDEAVLGGLDWVLAQLPRHNMMAVVSLGNYWTWSGGLAQMVSWATDTSIPYASEWDPVQQRWTAGDYAAFLRYTNQFYTDSQAQQIYFDNVRRIVGRRNRVTGQLYARDTSILAWELLNEPQRAPGAEDFLAQAAQTVRALDTHHLVTVGAECKDGAEWFWRMHRDPAVTLASCHFWAANWGLYNATDPTESSLAHATDQMRRFVADTADWARALGLPVALLEYGLGRDAWGTGAGLGAYRPETPVTHRDKYYADVLRAVRQSGHVGSAFWAYAGSARPPEGPSREPSWTGDPPHEPAGWNSVFDSDHSTLEIIHLDQCPVNYGIGHTH
ncbi:hypothetical protein GGI07_005611 [Coemansia sp. Benny D115]|nr:hypothetical protein GGI07_005611 [Coemansia sp. Benny D115]